MSKYSSTVRGREPTLRGRPCRSHWAIISFSYLSTAAGPVPRRVAALLAPPLGRHPTLAVTTSVILAVATWPSAESVHDLCSDSKSWEPGDKILSVAKPPGCRSGEPQRQRRTDTPAASVLVHAT